MTMKLTEVFSALASGELASQTSLVDITTGVRPENYDKVITHINLGLADLYKRFNIRLGDAYILMLDGIAEYFLDSKYAQMNPNGHPTIRYILDSPEQPFRDDAIIIAEAFTEIGEPLPINDRTEEKSIFTPSQLSIQIPWKVPGDVINIVYRAMHQNIVRTDYDDIGDIELNLPRIYLEPLLFYVAHRHFAGVGGQSGTPASQGYYQKYIEKIKEIEYYGIVNKDLSASTSHQTGYWP